MSFAANEAPVTAWGAGLVAVFESQEHVERAAADLDRAGFGPAQVSIVGREDFNEARQLGFAVSGTQMRLWGRHGALWTRLAQSGAGVALAWVPFVGHVAATGPAAGALVGERWEAACGPHATALTKMLTLAGMSAGQARMYEAAVRGGQWLLLVHGPAKSLGRARAALRPADAASNPSPDTRKD